MRRKVLLSDDDPDAREIAKIILELNGFEVYEANNASAVENEFYEKQPDAVILDLSIPGGGVEVMKRLKSRKAGMKIPILAFTAMSGTDERESLKRQGFDGIISKPCSPETIAEIVKKFLKE